jgi:hypothetical protein
MVQRCLPLEGTFGRLVINPTLEQVSHYPWGSAHRSIELALGPMGDVPLSQEEPSTHLPPSVTDIPGLPRASLRDRARGGCWSSQEPA